jgi:hypothetical protein
VLVLHSRASALGRDIPTRCAIAPAWTTAPIWMRLSRPWPACERRHAVVMDEDDPLVLAMPIRELYRVRGFTRAIALPILESLQQDSWFSAAGHLALDPMACEVRLGLLVRRPGEVLVGAGGEVLQATAIPHQVTSLGSGLQGIRDLARASARQLLGTDVRRLELVGYGREPSLQECRSLFILVYEGQAGAGIPAPAGMSWEAEARLATLPVDPVSALLVQSFFAPAAERTRPS